MDLMIDLETWGTNSDCVVVSIGAVFFDTATKQLGATFYLPLEMQPQLDRGRKITADTIKWWMSQTDAAKKVFKEGAQDPLKVLQLFTQFYKQIPDTKVWGNGSTFDITIMENLYKSYGLKEPWAFRNVMDLRTFVRFQGNGDKVAKQGVDHNALDDAISQANFVLEHVV